MHAWPRSPIAAASPRLPTPAAGRLRASSLPPLPQTHVSHAHDTRQEYSPARQAAPRPERTKNAEFVALPYRLPATRENGRQHSLPSENGRGLHAVWPHVSARFVFIFLRLHLPLLALRAHLMVLI